MIFEAGLIAFFRTLLIFAAIYYAFKLIMRFLFPWVIKRFLNKQFSSFNDGNPNSGQSKGAANSSSEKVKKKKDNLGEYVEYEEIKDENEKN